MAQIDRRLLREDIYEEVLKKILHGVLVPGTRVRDTALAAELGVSRTPVREALVRLVEEGFLRADAGRGFTVRQLNPNEVRDTYPILGNLEGLALRQSPEFPPELIQRLREISHQLDLVPNDLTRRIQLDGEWHRTLLSGCRNKGLLSLIDSLKEMMLVYEYDYARTASAAQSTDEHTRIVNALTDGDLDTAVNVLQENFHKTMDRLLARLGERFPESPSTP